MKRLREDIDHEAFEQDMSTQNFLVRWMYAKRIQTLCELIEEKENIQKIKNPNRSKLRGIKPNSSNKQTTEKDPGHRLRLWKNSGKNKWQQIWNRHFP